MCVSPITWSRRRSRSGIFAFVQCVLFVLIGNYVLQIRGMFWVDLGIVFMTAMGGVSLGLVVSSLVADPKTAANIVPLVLIPQIIMGGALIKYEDMNRNLALVYALTHWFKEHPTKEQGKKMESKLQVPFVCQFIAMRWSYEELVVAQAKLNPLTRRQDNARSRDRRHRGRARSDDPATLETAGRSEGSAGRALRSGSEIGPASSIVILALIDQVLDREQAVRSRDFKDAAARSRPSSFTSNQKVSDLISNAEMEQSDYRRGTQPERLFRRGETVFRNEGRTSLSGTRWSWSVRPSGCSACSIGFCAGNWKSGGAEPAGYSELWSRPAVESLRTGQLSVCARSRGSSSRITIIYEKKSERQANHPL